MSKCKWLARGDSIRSVGVHVSCGTGGKCKYMHGGAQEGIVSTCNAWDRRGV